MIRCLEEGLFSIIYENKEILIDLKSNPGVLHLIAKNGTQQINRCSMSSGEIETILFGAEKACFGDKSGIIQSDILSSQLNCDNGYFKRIVIVRKGKDEKYWYFWIEEGYLKDFETKEVLKHHFIKIEVPISDKSMVSLLRRCVYYTYIHQTPDTEQKKPQQLRTQQLKEEENLENQLNTYLGDVREIEIMLISAYNTGESEESETWAYAVNKENGNKFKLFFPGLLPAKKENENFRAKVSLVDKKAYFINEA